MMNVRRQKLGNTTVLHCVGRLTFPCADALRNLALGEAHGRRLVLDLADVTTIDAAGLGALVSLRSWSKQNGKKLKLMNVNAAVQGRLRLTGLDSAFEICSTREMLDLLCCALHEAAPDAFMPVHQELAGAEALAGTM